ALLTKNACIGSPDGLYQFWCTAKAEDYWPVTNSSLWIEWRLWGMNSAGYHVANLILHAAEALLIWIILRRLSIPGAFWAALIFAVHPVNVESVAWISQRKNMMAMLFFLLSILWYLKADMTRASVGLAPARSHGGPGELEKTFSSFILHPSSFHFCYWLSLAAFVLAMLSKGSAVILPVLLLGIVWWLRPLIRLDLMRTAPFFLVAMALAAVNMWFQTHGTAIVIRTASFSQRLLGAGGVLWFYLYKAIMPVDLVFIYPQWNIKTGNPLWWLPLFAALAVTAILWRNRASWGRPFLFAWGFFCVALAPAMGFTDVGFMKYSLVADHYQHIAIIGLIALVSAGWSAWHCLARGKAGWAATAVAIAAAAALTGLTWRQNMLYRGEITLYQSTLEKNPNCWLAHNNLGIAVVEAGRPQDAFPHYRQALLLRPGYHETLYNMGNAFRITGQNQQAIECYRQALEQKPDFIDALINLGLALDLANRPNEAILQYQKALDINPDLPDAQFHLGNAYKELGQYQKAIEHYRQSLLLKPDYIVQNDLGDLLARTGRISEAIEQYRQALAINPDFSVTHYNLGNALFQSGRTQEAIDHYRIALALKPDYFEVHNN
ncbi:MAG: tetratricopeptide repeat protein, partial [Thermoguttaceae bacterium]